jgi:hypothetical protein
MEVTSVKLILMLTILAKRAKTAGLTGLDAKIAIVKLK